MKRREREKEKASFSWQLEQIRKAETKRFHLPATTKGSQSECERRVGATFVKSLKESSVFFFFLWLFLLLLSLTKLLKWFVFQGSDPAIALKSDSHTLLLSWAAGHASFVLVSFWFLACEFGEPYWKSLRKGWILALEKMLCEFSSWQNWLWSQDSAM